MINPGYDGFLWFLGVVNSIDDPKKLGRVKIRLFTEYTKDKVLDDDLPWAMIMTPTTSASFLGIGESPTGIDVGSRVVGFFLDGNKKTKPMIIGTFPIIHGGNEDDHSVSTYARGNGPVQKEYLEGEPETAYAAQYPFNKTFTTKAGHVIEIDNTPKAERLHIFHKAGAYIEIGKDGDIVTKSPAGNIELSVKNKTIHVESGDVVINSKAGEVVISAKSNVKINAENIEITGSTVFKGPVKIDGKTSINGSTDIQGTTTINGIKQVKD